MRFLIVPGNNSLSHLAKGLVIAEELCGRGHEVTLTCTEANSHFLKQASFPWCTLPDIQENDNASMPTLNWFKDPEKIVSCIEAERALYKKIRPDKVLGIFNFTARISAELENIPYDSLVCGCMLPECLDTLGCSENDPSETAYRQLLNGFFSYAAIKFNIALKDLGVEVITDIRQLLKGDHTFLWDFPEFAPLADVSDMTYVGPLFWQKWPFDLEDISSLSSNVRPLALITSGTCNYSAKFTERICRILLKMGFNLVITTNGLEKLCRELQDDDRITVCRFVPFQKLLPHVSLLISHGGQMTIFEALLHEVPVVVQPLQAEQAQNGICLERMGCGKMLVPPQLFTGDSKVYLNAFMQISDEAITNELNSFLEDSHLAENLVEARRTIEMLPGEKLLADCLEGIPYTRGIILVHGYTGSSADLDPLARSLKAKFGDENVLNILLPGHGLDCVPPFALESFRAAINDAVGRFRCRKKSVTMIGHSTGGNLILDFLTGTGFRPSLLVLLATPYRIDLSYLERWAKHRSDRAVVPFAETAKMISLINSTSCAEVRHGFPALLLHGDRDALVPASESRKWQKNYFAGPSRLVIVPGVDHHFFGENHSLQTIDLICRAIDDLQEAPDNNRDTAALAILREIEPVAGAFLDSIPPGTRRHLAQSPAVLNLNGVHYDLAPTALTEPIIANIEVTTRCNLKCRHCARSSLSKQGRDMSPETFSNILGILPQVFQVNIVGLGEPLMHPGISELVGCAVQFQRKVGLVSNSMLLDNSMADDLIASGLHSIAFSLDAADQELAESLRHGTDLERVLVNIRNFVTQAASLNHPLATAVFSAVSMKSVPRLAELFKLVASLGVSVQMLTDLNFRENVDASLWKNMDPQLEEMIRRAVRQAFADHLPVISVHGLEEFGLATRYDKFLLIPPASLYRRSTKRTWCCSPWQTVPIDVEGNVTLCDCQPEIRLGNILNQPFAEIWNGAIIKEHRRAMLSENPPEACRICPRY